VTWKTDQFLKKVVDSSKVSGRVSVLVIRFRRFERAYDGKPLRLQTGCYISGNPTKVAVADTMVGRKQISGNLVWLETRLNNFKVSSLSKI